LGRAAPTLGEFTVENTTYPVPGTYQAGLGQEEPDGYNDGEPSYAALLMVGRAGASSRYVGNRAPITK
jgi:hypothetical protein